MPKITKKDALEKAASLFPVDTKEMYTRLELVATNNPEEGAVRIINLIHTAKVSKLKAIKNSPLGADILEVAMALPKSTELRKFYRTLKDLRSFSPEELSTKLPMECITPKDQEHLATVIGDHSADLCKTLNKGCKAAQTPKTFGWWRDKLDIKGGAIYPVALEVKGYDRTLFYKKLHALQGSLDLVNMRSVVKNPWGVSNEGFYKSGGWTWPASVLEMVAKGVPPSKAFYKMVMGKACPSLPY